MRLRRFLPIAFIVFVLVSLFAAVIFSTAQENDKDLQESAVISLPDDKKATDLQQVSQEIAPSVTKWPDTFIWRTVTTGAGSYPFTYFFTNLAFDLIRFGISGFDSSFAPWPFQNQNSASITNREKVARMGTAFGISIGIGLLDSIFAKP